MHVGLELREGSHPFFHERLHAVAADVGDRATHPGGDPVGRNRRVHRGEVAGELGALLRGIRRAQREEAGMLRDDLLALAAEHEGEKLFRLLRERRAGAPVDSEVKPGRGRVRGDPDQHRFLHHVALELVGVGGEFGGPGIAGERGDICDLQHERAEGRGTAGMRPACAAGDAGLVFLKDGEPGVHERPDRAVADAVEPAGDRLLGPVIRQRRVERASGVQRADETEQCAEPPHCSMARLAAACSARSGMKTAWSRMICWPSRLRMNLRNSSSTGSSGWPGRLLVLKNTSRLSG